MAYIEAGRRSYFDVFESILSSAGLLLPACQRMKVSTCSRYTSRHEPMAVLANLLSNERLTYLSHHRAEDLKYIAMLFMAPPYKVIDVSSNHGQNLEPLS